MSQPNSSFTGRSRDRQTRSAVRLADGVSRALITAGGIGTIVAVATVCLFLVAVVVPLFTGARFEGDAAVRALGVGDGARILDTRVDEYRVIGAAVVDDGTLVSFRTDDGTVLERAPLFPGRTPTAWSFDRAGGSVVAGFDDGTAAVLQIDFEYTFVTRPRDLEARLFDLAPGETTTFRDGIIERTVGGQFRLQRLVVTSLGEPSRLGDGAVRTLDHVMTEDGPLVAAVLERDDGSRHLVRVRGETSMDFMTGEETLSLGAAEAVPIGAEGDALAPDWLVHMMGGTDLVGVWTDGTVRRWRREVAGGWTVAETRRATDADDERVTAVASLLGERTILLGTSRGVVSGWFLARPPSADDPLAAGSADEFALYRAHAIETGRDAAVTALSTGTRSRMVAAGLDDGSVEILYVTAGERLVSVAVPSGAPVEAVAFSPKQDAVVVAAGDTAFAWDFDARYPETSARTLFAPIWYEGYAEPIFSWQSSSGSDATEPKLSLVPLVFGTIKATLYSMLFGAPVALLAAIFTSEFLSPRLRAVVKPTIELMASLPSVVLGFLAALVFAPYIETVIPATLACLLTIPFALIGGAMLWQLLPKSVGIRLSRHRIFFVALALPVGLLLAAILGGPMEGLLFGGSIRAWLAGRHGEETVGGPLGGWVLLLVPICGVVVAMAMTRLVNPRLRTRLVSMTRRQAAVADLLKFAVGSLAAVVLAVLAGLALGAAGFDVRAPLPGVGSVMDTFDQRNTLVVGIVMGFAIIPIIYTIADDALNTVPEHLRSASLGSGATPWQTTVRIVIPTAMSGLFSAVMIGLGRAVGETMIVLMALGNTPVMSLNVFEGARTLAANIAVELPEAAPGSAHYRTLFLAALVLFAMTFVLNTVAEVIRLRFRRRAYQL